MNRKLRQFGISACQLGLLPPSRAVDGASHIVALHHIAENTPVLIIPDAAVLTCSDIHDWDRDGLMQHCDIAMQKISDETKNLEVHLLAYYLAMRACQNSDCWLSERVREFPPSQQDDTSRQLFDTLANISARPPWALYKSSVSYVQACSFVVRGKVAVAPSLDLLMHQTHLSTSASSPGGNLRLSFQSSKDLESEPNGAAAAAPLLRRQRRKRFRAGIFLIKTTRPVEKPENLLLEKLDSNYIM